jgi:hypothetical protein
LPIEKSAEMPKENTSKKGGDVAPPVATTVDVHTSNETLKKPLSQQRY